MNKVEKFEDLMVWQESLSLAMRIYKELADCKNFGLKDQMQRCAVSVPSNIAEGFERYSNKEFIRFLRIAKGSAGELRTQLHVAIGVGLIDKTLGGELLSKTRLISSMIHNLIKVRLEKF